MARGDDLFQAVDVRIAAVASVALVAAVARGWHALVPVAVALAVGSYAAELALDDAPLDFVAPAIAVAAFFAAELAYWSLDESTRVAGEPGEGLRRAALLALGGLAVFVVASGLLVVADEVRARGIALDLLGAIAAIGVLVAVVLVARDQPSNGS